MNLIVLFENGVTKKYDTKQLLGQFPIYEKLKDEAFFKLVQVGEEGIMFECELMSSDFIEYDGEKVKVTDRYGNEKSIWHSGSINVPAGCFEAALTAKALNRTVPRARLTFGFTGEELDDSRNNEPENQRNF